MTPLQALKLYPKAVGWSVLLSLAIVMEGYDIVLLNSFYAFPAFVKKLANFSLMAGLSNGALVGEIFGLLIAGIASERYGYRKTMISALVAICGFVFIQFFTPNIETLQAAYILCGCAWGNFQVVTTTYA
ncbi:hypothetical protein V1517DRAFT_342455, partial [Lipomyces orientalis]